MQVNKFYYLVDFVILDLKGANSGKGSDLILGRPFLATCNAIINCRDGQLKISFGNMKIELNIFKTCRIVPNLEEVEEVSRIDSCINKFFRAEYEKSLIYVEFGDNELNDLNFEQVVGSRAAENWINRFEALPSDCSHVLPSSEQAP